MDRENGISLNQCITNLIFLLNLEALVNHLFNKYLSRASYNAGSILGTKGTAVNKTQKSPQLCCLHSIGKRQTRNKNK